MSTSVKYRSAAVDGHNVFYREAGDPRAPKIVLFGGFPSSSHQWRDLIHALASRGFHVVSPDYPGFGHTTSPDGFAFTFDNLSEVIEKWLVQIGFTSFGLYHQDYGGPIGNRIVARHPQWLQWQIVQNSNAYEEGFTQAWDGIRFKLWKDRNTETEDALRTFLTTEGVKSIYLGGHPDPELISPDNWTVDVAFLDLPGRREIQLDLLEDYKTNPPLYPAWQKALRETSRARSSSGAKATCSSPPPEARPTCATYLTLNCTASMPVTSPSRIIWSTSPTTSPASSTSASRSRRNRR